MSHRLFIHNTFKTKVIIPHQYALPSVSLTLIYTGAGHPFFRFLHLFPMSSHPVLEMNGLSPASPSQAHGDLLRGAFCPLQSELQRQLSTWSPSPASPIHFPHCQSSPIMHRYERVMAALKWLTFVYKRKSRSDHGI